MELELKHLAPYLPYKLKLHDVISNRQKVMNLGQGASTNWVGIKTVLSYYDNLNFIYQPILRPLNEIIYIKEVCDEFSNHEWDKFQFAFMTGVNPINKFDYLSYSQAELMFKHHIDVFGLIKKGLAIDVNLK